MRYLLIASLLVLTLLAAGCNRKRTTSAGSPSTSKAASSSGPAQNDPTAAERAKFTGTWIAASGEPQGGLQWTFDGDRVTYMTVLPGPKSEGRFTVNPNASPKTFDIRGDETILGIYEFGPGDTLKICAAVTQRPTSFSTAGATQDTVALTFKKAPAR